MTFINEYEKNQNVKKNYIQRSSRIWLTSTGCQYPVFTLNPGNGQFQLLFKSAHFRRPMVLILNRLHFNDSRCWSVAGSLPSAAGIHFTPRWNRLKRLSAFLEDSVRTWQSQISKGRALGLHSSALAAWQPTLTIMLIVCFHLRLPPHYDFIFSNL